MNKTTLFAACAAIMLATFPALADDKRGNKTGTMQDATMTDGVIRKVNKDAGKLTIKHAEIKHLDMPAMTMVFQVKDPAMLDHVKEGDKVRFSLESKGGAMTVTKIEQAK